MSKLIRKQLFQAFNTLQKANTCIRETILSGSEKKLVALLLDCQECAIAIGNKIEKVYGENTDTVQGLEEYCETIYKLASDEQGEVDSRKVYEDIETQLNKIYSNMEREISDKLEVVFFPYKASMWDSLESVWAAAKEDEECEPYVVPIPYYDKNHDGSLGEMHYEGDEYPDYVPITSWEKYDLEERRPDIVYIHNPYDECNIVTSVHPDYYSKVLKTYTGRLVYIPYFVLEEICPDDISAIEKMRHFCTVPAVFNADKIIVQSIDMRKIYIRVLTKEYGDGTREIWERKIEGLGSPKIEKTLVEREKDIRLPAEWEKIIFKNGVRKKVLFYNTSVNALLVYRRSMIKKIQQVINILREFQEQVTLLWRPHPLLKATIISMCPELELEYRNICEEFKREDWGIYDDSADMDRALTISNAYYGDPSSVMQLCRQIPIPIMYQNVFANEKIDSSLDTESIVLCNGKYWLLAIKDNGIYCMSRKDHYAELMKRIPWEDKLNVYDQYQKIFVYNNKLILVPWKAHKIAIYCTENNNLSYIEYEILGYRNQDNKQFAEGMVEGKYLYLISYVSSKIICVNMEEETAESIQNKTKLYKFLPPEVLERYIEGEILSTEDGVWVIPHKTTKILFWNRKLNQMQTYIEFPKGYEPGEWSFYKGCIGAELYLIPRESNMFIAVDLKMGRMREIFKDVSKERTNYWSKVLFHSIWDDEGLIYMIDFQNGYLLSENRKGEKFYKKIEKKKVESEKLSLTDGIRIIECENEGDSLRSYINGIIEMKQKATCNKPNCVGKKIYEKLKCE